MGMSACWLFQGGLRATKSESAGRVSALLGKHNRDIRGTPRGLPQCVWPRCFRPAARLGPAHDLSTRLTSGPMSNTNTLLKVAGKTTNY